MQALQLTAFRRPDEVGQLVTLPDPEQPGPQEVLVAVEATPIHGSDLLLLSGFVASGSTFGLDCVVRELPSPLGGSHA